MHIMEIIFYVFATLVLSPLVFFVVLGLFTTIGSLVNFWSKLLIGRDIQNWF